MASSKFPFLKSPSSRSEWRLLSEVASVVLRDVRVVARAPVIRTPVLGVEATKPS